MLNVDPWPFDQARNCAVFTTRLVVERREPILHVTHDADDHGWQFIGSSDGTRENHMIIAFHEAVEVDPFRTRGRRFARWLARRARVTQTSMDKRASS